jgi:hypothetical protein
MAHLFLIFSFAPKFRDLDLDIAKIPFPRYSLSFLLLWICALLRTGWSPFESAVPIVGNKAFTFVFLGAAVRVDVVDVREVDLESGGIWD